MTTTHEEYNHTMELISIIEHCMENNLRCYLQTKNIEDLQFLINNLQRLIKLKIQAFKELNNLKSQEDTNQ